MCWPPAVSSAPIQIRDLDPMGFAGRQCTVFQAPIRTPGGELIIDPDHQTQGRARADRALSYKFIINVKVKCLPVPGELVSVPLGGVNGEGLQIVLDELGRQLAQEAGTRPPKEQWQQWQAKRQRR